MTRFAVIGSGFRAEAFMRVASLVPGLEVTGVLARDSGRGAELERAFGVRTHRDLAAALGGDPDFAVVAVAKAASEEVVTAVAAAGVAVLAETPPAPDVAGLARLHALVRGGARIQVAEQYHLEPLVSAQIAVTRSGLLGDVSEALVSVAHDYHGISVLRRLLGIGFEDATVTAHESVAPLAGGPDRAGDPAAERVLEERHITARLDFGGRVGTYDFSSDQYRSWIRSGTVLVRGDRGELRDETVRRMVDHRTPLLTRIERLAAGGPGNHEGMFLRGLTLGDRWLYRNELLPARLPDEELSVAALLRGMGEHVAGGPEVYSLAEAAQDQYLALAVRRSVETGAAVRTSRQVWAP